MNNAEIFDKAADILIAASLEGLREAVSGEVNAPHVTGQIKTCAQALRDADVLRGRANLARIVEEAELDDA